jgi:hypothetical protein
MTYDAGQVTVVLEDPTYGLALGVGRSLSPRVAAAEAIQLIGGFHNPELMVWASPAFKKYMDGYNFHGAYGDRIGTQVELAVAKLEDDLDTRQAVITLWDPEKDNEGGLHDYPCTVALGFSRRDHVGLPAHGVLDMHVTMRSNDVWLGFPYDVFQFTQLQLTVARMLDLPVGEYTHTAWSMHLYERDRDMAIALPIETIEVYQPQGIGTVRGLGTTGARLIRRRAADLVYGRHDKLGQARPMTDLTESEEWYRANLAAYTTHVG